MKCLNCSSQNWNLVEEWSEATVENIPVKVKAPMYKCVDCGQTSATAEQMLSLTIAWMKAYKTKRFAGNINSINLPRY